MHKKNPLVKDLDILLEKSRNTTALSIGEIFETFSGKGYKLILIFLSLPFCQPIQIPGLSMPFGLVIAFISLRMTFGKRLLLPKKFLLKTISSTTIQTFAEKTLKLMNMMSHLIHPRLVRLCNHGIMKVVNGLLIFLLGILLALPLPIPLTNLAAGWSILLVSLGLLGNDGLFVLLGYLVSLFTLLFFIFLILFIKNHTHA